MKKYEFTKDDMENIHNAITGIWFKANKGVKDINRAFRKIDDITKENAMELLGEMHELFVKIGKESSFLEEELEEDNPIMKRHNTGEFIEE